MTNFEYLKSLSVDETAKWLSQYDDMSYMPWDVWFDNTYCKKCDSINTYVPALEREAECAYCEINDTCQFFKDHKGTLSPEEVAELWLESEVAKNENT